MQNPIKRKAHELSFTLLEVIVAVGMLTAVVLQVAGGQGSLFEITDYSRRATEATWLAKRLMSEIEYNYSHLELKDLETTTSIKDEPFKDLESTDSNDYRYSIDIQEWKFPLIDVLMNGGPKPAGEEAEEAENDESKPAAGGIPGADAIVKQIFDGHILKIAHVEVSWPEGAQRNAVTLSYLLTNQKALDTYILSKKAIWEGIKKKMDPNAPKEGAKTPAAGTAGQPAGGTGGASGNNPNTGGNTETNTDGQTPQEGAP